MRKNLIPTHNWYISDGNWGSWSTLSSCSLSCGGGTQSRTRLCNHPAPSNGGSVCLGQGSETTACNEQHCPIGETNIKFKNNAHFNYLLTAN
jgi:hypothetical protein